MTHPTVVSLSATLLILFIAPFAFAHDGVVHTTEAEAQAHLQADPKLPLRPLDFIKMQARQIKENAQGAKIELRANTKTELENAGPGERKDILKGAVGARVDIAKERRASTTDLKQDFRSLIRFHGGEIKNRFTLAIRHLNNILDRIHSRLDKMAAAGVDVSAAEQLEIDAGVAIDKAEADAQAVAAFVAAINESSDRKAVKAELQAKIKTVQDSLKDAHQAVMKVVRALVKLAVDNKAKLKVDASVSATTSVQ